MACKGSVNLCSASAHRLKIGMYSLYISRRSVNYITDLSSEHVQPLKPLNSLTWLTCDFSLQYQYIITQTGSENTQTYQVHNIILIEHQILITNLQGDVKQLKERINNQVLGVNGLTLWHQYPYSPYSSLYISFGDNKEDVFSNHSSLGWQSFGNLYSHDCNEWSAVL